jgi:hypothetical protein
MALHLASIPGPPSSLVSMVITIPDFPNIATMNSSSVE